MAGTTPGPGLCRDVNIRPAIGKNQNTVSKMTHTIEQANADSRGAHAAHLKRHGKTLKHTKSEVSKDPEEYELDSSGKYDMENLSTTY
ncbi:hypothetical protein GBA52_003106 [Prunus armeniaca]|nr:hypothetical protein GBA52_003106 [Prunus armeniaca]